MRRVSALLLCLLVVLLAAAVPTAQAGTPSGGSAITAQVVGGSNAATGQVPWQALVYADGAMCGGSVLDDTHVVTAAHCVYDEKTHSLASPAKTNVYAGLTDRHQVNGTAKHGTVTAVTIDPDYEPDFLTDDAAILTLAPPGLDLPNRPDIHAIPLTAVGYAPTLTENLVLSGWGTTAPRSPSAGANTDPISWILQVAPALHASTGCTIYWAYDPQLHLCAGGTASYGPCQGDSGGPLVASVNVSGVAVMELAGIVSGAGGCGVDGYPAVFARVADPGIHAFLAARGVGYAVPAPVATADPTVVGTPAPGATLVCNPGTWIGARDYAFRFELSDGTVLNQLDSLRVSTALSGSSIRCVVTGLRLTSAKEVASGWVAVADLASPTPPAPTAAPAAPPAPPVAPAVDTTAPTARFGQLHCTRTMCLLSVTVDDPAPSSGVAHVEARVTTAYRTRCGRKHRPCTKTVTHRLTATPATTSSFRVKTARLRKGTQTFTLVATDLRGNRQAVATTLKKRTG